MKTKYAIVFICIVALVIIEKESNILSRWEVKGTSYYPAGFCCCYAIAIFIFFFTVSVCLTGFLISWSRGRPHSRPLRLLWIAATQHKTAPWHCSRCCCPNSPVRLGITQISQRARRKETPMIWASLVTAAAVSTCCCWPPRVRVPRLWASSSTSTGRTCSTCLSLCGMWSACWPWQQKATTGRCWRESTGMCSRGSSCVISLHWRSSFPPHPWTTSPRLFSVESPAYHCVRSPSALLPSKMSLRGKSWWCSLWS